MTTEKFETEVDTLKKFFTTYCHNKHQNQKKYNRVLEYNDKKFEVILELCDECSNLLDYAFDRLLINCQILLTRLKSDWKYFLH